MTSSSLPDSKLHYGLKIEREAESWLLANRPVGTRLIARNYRWRGGELDLILEEPVRGGVELVFVEVRADLQGLGQRRAERDVS